MREDVDPTLSETIQPPTGKSFLFLFGTFYVAITEKNVIVNKTTSENRLWMSLIYICFSAK